jgi:hypothetical protein
MTWSTSFLFSQLLLALILLEVGRRFYSWYRLSHIPGPKYASVSRLWMIRHTLSGKLNLALKDATDKYGSILDPTGVTGPELLTL